MSERWPEYLDARFSPLSAIDADLAERLSERVVDQILPRAGLSVRHRDEALAQTMIEVGVLPDGRPCVLSVTLPLGSGRPEYRWDGSVEAAEAVIDSAAERGVEDVVGDREIGYPTGWEPEFDEPPTAP